ncbi:MAG: hypothetical protein OHK0012_11020 [Synechococcales cyanobacterium]
MLLRQSPKILALTVLTAFLAGCGGGSHNRSVAVAPPTEQTQSGEMPTGDPIDTPLPETGDPVEDLLLNFPVFDDEDSLLRLSSDTIRSNLWRPYGLITEGPNYVLAQFSAQPTKSGLRRISGSNPTRSPLLYTGLLGRARGIVRDGNFYIVSDSVGGRLFRASVNGGFANEFATGLGTPVSVALIAPGEYVVTDLTGGRLLKVLADGTVTVLADAGLGSPYGVAVESPTSFIVTDAIGKRLLRVTDTGSVTELVTSGLDQPRGVRIASPNRVVVADFGVGKDTGRVLDIDVSGSPVITVVRSGGNPTDLVIRESSPELKIAFTDFTNNQLVEVDSTGGSPVVSTLADEDGTGIGCSLREAIIANNTDADFGGCTDPNGTISFANSLTGTITLTNAPPQISQDVVIDGPGAAQLAVSGNNAQRVFDIGSNLTVAIQDLTITQGSTSGSGGGIQAGSGTDLTITNSTFSGNTATSYGGSIYGNNASITITDTEILNSSGSRGGAVFHKGNVMVDIKRSTISNNHAGAVGGGIFKRDGGTLSVENSTISGNSLSSSTSRGGGIYAYSTRLIVNNSTISNNLVNELGGGLLLANVTATITNSTITGNTANVTNGGGGFYTLYPSLTTLRNTIISGNTAISDPECGNGGATVITNGRNLFGVNNSSGSCPVGASDIVPGTGVVIGDILAPLADNGGPTLTHALVTDSPALEAGDPAICAAAPVNNLDQRGVTRPQTGTNCDIGAFESDLPTPAIVTTTIDNSTPTDGLCSLREAIAANNANAAQNGCRKPNGTITFANSLTGQTIALGAAPQQITQNVAIHGPGASNLTVSGNNQFRVFDIGEDLTVTIDGLTITSGSTSGKGGGIQTDLGTSLTVTNSILSGNRAAYGGAIYTQTATVSNSTLSNNSATVIGGGVYGFFNAQVSNSTLSGNSAGVYGGGIFTSTAIVSDSTFNGNRAGETGGGIRATTLTLSNSTLSSNRATTYGGGLYSTFATVSDSTFSGNSANYGGGIKINSIFLAQATISNSTFSGNTAGTSGGAISKPGGTMTLTANKFGTAVPSGTANVAPIGPNVDQLTGSTGTGNDPASCNANSGSC